MPGGDNVADTLTSLIAKVGENMKLRRLGMLSVDNGVVAGYSHMGGKIGALVAIENGSGELGELGKDVAMHVAAAAPRYLKSDEVSQDELNQEKELAKKKLEEQGKPADLIEKIMMGQMNKFYKEICLMEQAFIKDPNFSVSKLLKEQGKGATLTGFLRFALGEGIEKKEENFAEEVAAAVKGN
jgi:elongation factor Ts